MTYEELYMQNHPEMTPDEMEQFMLDRCPDGEGVFEPKFEDIICVMGSIENACPKCWNREVPGTEPTMVLDPKTEQVMVDFLENGLGGVGTIKDSGSRMEFGTGAVRDIQEGKGRCDLMPLEVVAQLLGGRGDDKSFDAVIDHVKLFQLKGDTEYLYHAIDTFTKVAWKDRTTMLLEVAKHFEEGAKKYGENNWQKGLPIRCYINSAVRHYLKWLRGDKDEPHDRAFCWNILCAIWTCKYKPELNDYAPKQNENTCVCCGAVIPEGQQVCPKCKF